MDAWDSSMQNVRNAYRGLSERLFAVKGNKLKLFETLLVVISFAAALVCFHFTAGKIKKNDTQENVYVQENQNNIVKPNFAKLGLVKRIFVAPFNWLKCLFGWIWNGIKYAFSFIIHPFVNFKGFHFNLKDIFLAPYRALKWVVLKLVDFVKLIVISPFKGTSFNFFGILKTIFMAPYHFICKFMVILLNIIKAPFIFISNLFKGCQMPSLKQIFLAPYQACKWLLKSIFTVPYKFLKWLVKATWSVISWPFIKIYKFKGEIKGFLVNVFVAPYKFLKWIIKSVWSVVSWPFVKAHGLVKGFKPSQFSLKGSLKKIGEFLLNTFTAPYRFLKWVIGFVWTVISKAAVAVFRFFKYIIFGICRFVKNIVILTYSFIKKVFVFIWKCIKTPFIVLCTLVKRITRFPLTFKSLGNCMVRLFTLPYRILKAIVIALWNIVACPFVLIFKQVKKLGSAEYSLKNIFLAPYHFLKMVACFIWRIITWPFVKIVGLIKSIPCKKIGCPIKKCSFSGVKSCSKAVFMAPYNFLKFIAKWIFNACMYLIKGIYTLIKVVLGFLKVVIKAPFVSAWNLCKKIHVPSFKGGFGGPGSMLKKAFLAPYFFLKKVFGIVLYVLSLPFRFIKVLVSNYVIEPAKILFDVDKLKYFWDHVCDEFEPTC